jgi:decaprenyl-phosphate phosphoribosyltransferase
VTDPTSGRDSSHTGGFAPREPPEAHQRAIWAGSVAPVETNPARIRDTRPTWRALIRTARPKQWVKNLLVFAAPGAAGVLDDWPELGYTLLAFVAFCLAASGIYCWNDALDVEADRRHPTKRYRPVASGEVSVGTAQVTGTVLGVAALAVAAGTGRWQTVLVVAVYVAVTLAYSLWLKHIAVLDIATVAAGFLLRAAGGAVAVDVEMSQWFVLCTVFGSLFIVVGKRYAELREMGEDGPAVRATLADYTTGYLRIVLTLSCGAALVSYCLWAFETKEISGSHLPFYELSIVPTIIALLRYLLVLEQGHGAAPEEVFASDRILQVTGLAWVVVFGLGVYLT